MAENQTTQGTGGGRGVLKRGEKSVPERQFCKKTACSSYVQSWLVANGGWRLVVGGGWWLVIGGWRRLAVVGGWWRLVVPWGGLSKSSSLRTPLGGGFPQGRGPSPGPVQA